MDSSIPPPPSVGTRKLRPWYLVPAMVLAWCVGVRGLLNGCATVAFLRSGTLPDLGTVTRNAEGAGSVAELFAVYNAAGLAALQRLERITFPLSLAQVMLAALLMITSGLCMSGRRGARAVAIQALVANALLVGLTYALTRSVRVASVDAVVAAAQTLGGDLAQRGALPPQGLWWWPRINLAGEITPLLLAAIALTRPRTKMYFDAVARAAESAEEP